jgi:hypothetical protein
MKWFLLFSLMACSTPKTPETSPTESDAKPVSPLTVQPCLCMKIFQPVCAGGVNYGNSCDAECNGHKTWTEGSCGKKK